MSIPVEAAGFQEMWQPVYDKYKLFFDCVAFDYFGRVFKKLRYDNMALLVKKQQGRGAAVC